MTGTPKWSEIRFSATFKFRSIIGLLDRRGFREELGAWDEPRASQGQGARIWGQEIGARSQS